MKNLSEIPLDNEISLKDIFDFLLNSWKTILIFVVIGLLCSIGYIWLTPNQYSATAQIQIAQYSGYLDATNASNSYKSNYVMSPIGINVEEPARLITRLQLPSTYSEEVIDACGLKNSENSKENLAKLVRATPMKASNSVVEVTIKLNSKDMALSCANTIFEAIKASQALIAEPYFDSIKNTLSENLLQISRAQATFLETSGKGGQIVTPANLLARDEINRLSENNIFLQYLLQFREIRKRRLVSPIYVSTDPVSPKKLINILVGLLGGLVIGLLIALVHNFVKVNRI